MMAMPISCSAFRRTALILALVAGGMPAFAQESTDQSASQSDGQSATQIASNQPVGEVVLIPNRVIYPGETIELTALKQVTLIPGKHKPDAMATRTEELQGKIAKRTLLPGRYIPSAAIREAWLVEQGAAVQVFFIAGGLTISATAVTWPCWSLLSRRLSNSDSGKILSGTVMADGTIQVSAS